MESVAKLTNICRTCLLESVDMKDIFSSSLDRIIQECTSLEVLIYDITSLTLLLTKYSSKIFTGFIWGWFTRPDM